MSKPFASYEKVIISKVEKIHHIVNIKLNESPQSIISLLSRIPKTAVLTSVVGDDEIGSDYAELTFEEEVDIE